MLGSGPYIMILVYQVAVAEERLRASQSELEAMQALMHTMSLQPAGLEPAGLGQQMSARIALLVKQRRAPSSPTPRLQSSCAHGLTCACMQHCAVPDTAKLLIQTLC